jgi:isopentenyl diphosphate isomerase/L-lactate dehydrogenase-like FMN-dependent dehydrogenase
MYSRSVFLIVSAAENSMTDCSVFVIKALALGAKAVLVGRLWIYGMGIAGEAGVRHVMKSLLADFDILLGVGGFNSISEINRSALSQ